MFDDRLKQLREAKQLSRQQVSDVLNIKSRTYASYENNEREPNSEILIKLSNFFGVSVDYLLGINISSNAPPHSIRDSLNERQNIISLKEKQLIDKYRQLDAYGIDMVDTVLQKEYERCTAEAEEPDIDVIPIKYINAPVSAGLGDMLDDYENTEKVKVPLTRESRKANFVLRVHGQSMEPLYFDGDYVLVRQQPVVDIGQIGIFAVDGEGYIKKMGENMLISLNPDYPNVELDEYTELKCFGLVLGTTEIID